VRVKTEAFCTRCKSQTHPFRRSYKAHLKFECFSILADWCMRLTALRMVHLTVLGRVSLMSTVKLVIAIALCLWRDQVNAKLRFPAASSVNSLRDIDMRGEPPLLFREKILGYFDKFKFPGTGGTSKAPVIAADTDTSVTSGPTPSRIRRLFQFGGGISNKKKLLILMSDTGGGHRASAQALDQALKEQYPNKIDVTVMDIWTDHAGWPFNKFVPMYRFLAKNPLLWQGFYNYGLFPPTKLFTELDSHRVCYQAFSRAIERANPDFVVSVHPLCQLMPLSILREMNQRRVDKPRIPFVTVVTDLGSAHPCWFDRRADAIYVPSDAVRDIALRNRIAPNKILMKGLPIRPAFWRTPAAKSVLRRTLGLVQDAKTVMLMGGGDGVGGLDNIATEVADKLQTLDLKTQLLVICGHNHKLRQKLTDQLITHHHNGGGRGRIGGIGGKLAVVSSRLSALAPWKLVDNVYWGDYNGTIPAVGQGTIAHHNPAAGTPSTTSSTSYSTNLSGKRDNKNSSNNKHTVNVHGFVQNVHEYMGASDLLVTKAGPGTIAEAMTRGLPLVLSSYLPGQVSC
jgi:UDP-N-acetylglucosamine:LPS N-acetylglucosamine transferase